MSGNKSSCDVQLPDPQDPGHLLRHLMMTLRVQAGDALGPLGFSLPQFGVLMSLKRAPGQSNADLARMAFVTPQTMGEVLSALEKAKLVRRKPHKENARILLANLTPAGEKALEQCKDVLDEMNTRMFSRMSVENKKQFGALLELCLVGLQSKTPSPTKA